MLMPLEDGVEAAHYGTRHRRFLFLGGVGGETERDQEREDFYGAQYDHILMSQKDSYENIRPSRFFYTIETSISSMR